MIPIDISLESVHSIKMRVMRQSSETRQATLDAKKQAIRDEVVFGKGLDTPTEPGQSQVEPRTGALGSLTATPRYCLGLSGKASHQSKHLS